MVEMKPIKIGMLGLGTVGSGVVRIIEGHQEDLQRRVGSPIQIEKICVRNIGKARNVTVDRAKLTEDPYELINNPDIDIIVEVMGGVEHTRRYVLDALENGKHVVTANKDLMALHGVRDFVQGCRKGMRSAVRGECSRRHPDYKDTG